jgi:pyocin large subunit-like protein
MKITGRKTVKGGTTSAPKTVTKSASAAAAPAAAAAVVAAAAPAEKAAPTRGQVARRAFEIYLARGGAPGHEVEDWAQAERELGA